MKTDSDCPFCNTQFTAIENVDGECPCCGEKYIWDFDCDYEGAVIVIDWVNKNQYGETINR